MSDCYGLSIAYVSALRAGGVPARVIVGRWARPSVPGKPQHHCKAEFHLDGVGWVPVDPTVGVESGGEKGFGSDAGDFFIMHVDTDLAVITPGGRLTIAGLQGISFNITASSSTSAPKLTQDENWKILSDVAVKP